MVSQGQSLAVRLSVLRVSRRVSHRVAAGGVARQVSVRVSHGLPRRARVDGAVSWAVPWPPRTVMAKVRSRGSLMKS